MKKAIDGYEDKVAHSSLLLVLNPEKHNRESKGKMTYADGRVQEGIWDDDVFVG